MYRSRIKTPVLLPSSKEQLKDIQVITEKQTKVIQLMSAYIKGKAERDPTYTALKVLKESIT